MKKTFNTLIIVFGVITFINAQGITNTLGGNTAGDKFIVENKNSEAGLVVTGEGNVGIGKKNPQEKLDVSGAVRVHHPHGTTGDIKLGGPSGGVGISIWSMEPEYYRANIVRVPDGLGFGVHGATSNPGYGNLFIDNIGNVGIGTTNPASKLSVGGDGYSDVAIYSVSTGTSGRGVYGIATGIYGRGVHGYTTGKYGVGVRGQATGTDGIGVYGNGVSSDFWAHNGTYGNTSSIRWKSNIVEIDNPLEILAEIRGVYFDWDEEHGGGHTVGMIAEEVGKVLPEIVFYEENGIDAKGMDYSKLTPLLVEAIKALQKRVEELINRIEELENK